MNMAFSCCKTIMELTLVVTIVGGELNEINVYVYVKASFSYFVYQGE